MKEGINGLYNSEVIHWQCWTTRQDVKQATLKSRKIGRDQRACGIDFVGNLPGRGQHHQKPVLQKTA
ncbi:hypothetical protein ACMYSN_12030 [Klebsiella sp. R445]